MPINEIMRVQTKGQPTPTLGMGATLLYVTDRTPATIAWVSSDAKIVGVRSCASKMVSGNALSETQEYEFFPEEMTGPTRYFRFRLNQWEEVYLNNATNRWRKSGTTVGLKIGVRQQYRDPSF